MKPGRTGYRGRFAPSPTGPLHFGSLVGALASYLDARYHGGQWLVRIEDIDPLRTRSGAAVSILRTLEAHALHWDGDVFYQSQQAEFYESILQEYLLRDVIYRCPCSRAQLQRTGLHLQTCARRQVSAEQIHALRFAVTAGEHTFNDLIQGIRPYSLSATDDFVVKRKEGFYAYQLAVVADDHQQNITHVIRGIDLIESTPLQLQLYRNLGWYPPGFGHFPVVMDKSGKKLSKHYLAPALDSKLVLQNLSNAALALQLTRPEEKLPETPEAIIQHLTPRWSRERYRCITELSEPELDRPTR